MKTSKLILSGALVVAGLTWWQVGCAVAQETQSREPVISTALKFERASFFKPGECKPRPTAGDLEIKLYYLDHISDFQPLPHSPRERAKVWSQIESSIKHKLGRA